MIEKSQQKRIELVSRHGTKQSLRTTRFDLKTKESETEMMTPVTLMVTLGHGPSSRMRNW